MNDHIRHSPEDHLELLLRNLLGEEPTGLRGASLDHASSPEVAELLDLARRLRASFQWIPLPEGHKALRRALLTREILARSDWASRRFAFPPQRLRLGWRSLVGAAAVLILGVLGLGSGGVATPGSPSSPWYGVRVALEELSIALIPSPMGKAERLVKATQARIAEIEAVTASGDTRALRRAADALDGEAGWLHSVMTTLSAADRQRVRRALESI